MTGPPVWNKLKLAPPIRDGLMLVYTKGSAEVEQIDDWTVEFKRRRFPLYAEKEYYAIDLLNNRLRLSLDREQIKQSLIRSVRKHRLNRSILLELAEEYGTRWTRKLVWEVRYDSDRALPAVGDL